MRARRLTAGALVALVTGLGGCGTDGESSSGARARATPLDHPTCPAVWVVGKVIPQGYDGCRNDHIIEGSVTGDCGSGEGSFYVYQDHMWAVGSNPIRDTGDLPLFDNPQYRTDFNACFGSATAYRER